jgi:hypothetical protein
MQLVNRIRHADIYHLGGDNFSFHAGGGISNCQDWNGDSDIWTPERFTLNDIVNEGGNIRSIRTGHWAYAFNKGKTLQGGFAGNEFRVYPIRGRLDVYYSIAPQTPVDLEYDAIPARKAIKIYKDSPDVQYAFFTGIAGWKLADFIRPSYASDTFEQKFNVRLEGGIYRPPGTRYLMYQGNVVGKLPDPYFEVKATGEIVPAIETLNAGELTLSISGLQALDLSQGGILDPTLGPVNPSKDTHFLSWNPTAGFGQSFNLNLVESNAPRTIRQASQTDVSAIPSGSTVTSATYEIKTKSVSAGSPVGRTIEIARLNTEGFEDAGTGTIGAEANWNNYKDPNVAWPVGAGAQDVDETYLVTTTIAAIGSWTAFSVVDLMQDAVDNHSGIFNTRVKYEQEGITGGLNGDSVVFHSLEAATAADRPKVTVEYTVPEGQQGGLMGGGFWGQETLMGGGIET